MQPLNVETGDSWDRGVRLLSLYGNTGGNLRWQLNRYKDGSGQWFDVIPFKEKADAEMFARQKFAQNIEAKLRAEFSREKAPDVVAVDRCVHAADNAVTEKRLTEEELSELFAPFADLFRRAVRLVNDEDIAREKKAIKEAAAKRELKMRRLIQGD